MEEAVSVDLKEPGFEGSVEIKDLWSGKRLGNQIMYLRP